MVGESVDAAILFCLSVAGHLHYLEPGYCAQSILINSTPDKIII